MHLTNLTPLDKNTLWSPLLPTPNITLKRKIRKEYLPLYLVDIEVDKLNPNDVSKSLQNLERLGLLTIDFLKWRRDDEVYNKLIDNSYIESLKAWVNQITGESYIAKVGSKGLLELNDFARDFAEVCLR